MTALFALHHARWGAASEAFTPAREALHREVAAAALREGWLRLWLLEVAGAPVAVWYGFRSGGREWYYQAGRDPAFERDSIGFVLLAHTLRAAIEDGVTEYRMLRGDEAYKSRFATREDELQTRVLGGTVVGRVAARAVAVAAGRPAARARLKKFEQRPGAEGMVEAAR